MSSLWTSMRRMSCFHSVICSVRIAVYLAIATAHARVTFPDAALLLLLKCVLPDASHFQIRDVFLKTNVRSSSVCRRNRENTRSMCRRRSLFGRLRLDHQFVTFALRIRGGLHWERQGGRTCRSGSGVTPHAVDLRCVSRASTERRGLGERAAVSIHEGTDDRTPAELFVPFLCKEASCPRRGQKSIHLASKMDLSTSPNSFCVVVHVTLPELTALWLLPTESIPGSDRGYDYQIRPHPCSP